MASAGRTATLVRWTALLALGLGLVAPARAASEVEAVATLAAVEGDGGARFARGPEALTTHERKGCVTVAMLAKAERLPAHFLALRPRLKCSPEGACPCTLPVLLDEIRRLDFAVKAASQALRLARSAPCDAPPPPDAEDLLRGQEASLHEMRAAAAQCRELWGFLEGREYLDWADAAAGEALPDGAAVRAGDGTTLRLDVAGGASLRLLPGASLLAFRRPPEMKCPPAPVVAHLHRGVLEVTVPSGEEARLGVVTDRVILVAVGARFTVRHGDGATVVEVAEGTVETRDRKTCLSAPLAAGSTTTFGQALGPAPEPEETVVADGWGVRTAGGLALAVPCAWSTHAHAVKGQVAGWAVGPDPEAPDAAVYVVRGRPASQILGGVETTKTEEVAVGGLTATRHEGRKVGSDLSVFLLAFDAETEAEPVAVLVTVFDPKRDAYAAAIERILGSVRPK